MLLYNIAYAANAGANLADKIKIQLINPLIQGLFVVAILIFIFGVVEMVFKADSPEGRATGKRHIIWGLVGFVIMIGVWGIVSIIQSIIP